MDESHPGNEVNSSVFLKNPKAGKYWRTENAKELVCDFAQIAAL